MVSRKEIEKRARAYKDEYYLKYGSHLVLDSVGVFALEKIAETFLEVDKMRAELIKKIEDDSSWSDPGYRP